jgi:cytochrome c556
MKTFRVFRVGICVLVSWLLGAALTGFLVARTSQGQGTSRPGNSLPARLDDLYPPKAKEPVFLFRMIGLADAFGGFLGDLFENDLPNVPASLEKFKAEYKSVAELVPEWKTRFPLAPVEELEAALKTTDQGKIVSAAQKIGEACTACHIETMARVQHKYDWPDFSAIRVKDPLIGDSVDFQQFMLALDVSYAAIRTDLGQGQAANAQKQYQGFKARFEAMADACGDCHGQDERKYYVDESVRRLVEDLGKAVAEPSPEKAGKLLVSIGIESCRTCHLIHVPAALAQRTGKK